MVLGIDIGATTIKCGIVSGFGDIEDKKVVDTRETASNDKFVENIGKIINEYLVKYPTLKGVGLGFPGLLSKDRTTVVEMANIPEAKSQNVVSQLAKHCPGVKVSIENDAKCATLGEKIFGSDKHIDNFMFITLGTGVGSGAFIDNKLFLGNGNACEVGHMITSTGKVLEHEVGLRQISEYTLGKLSEVEYKSSILAAKSSELSPKIIFDAANQGDALALHVWNRVGNLIGETLVNIMRVMDINTFILGGGVAGAFDHIKPSAEATIKKHLSTYYTDNLKIVPAELSNDAGILGAASLIYHEYYGY
jgi:glucokinase